MKFSYAENCLLFKSLEKHFEPNAQGRWRGRASYRNGKSQSSLSINATKGLWFDFPCNVGGDPLKFWQIQHGDDDFLRSCKWASTVLGRDVLTDHKPKLKGPRFTNEQLTRASLFADGYAMHVYESLSAHKELWLLTGVEQRSGAIAALTQLLKYINQWKPVEAAEFLRRFGPGRRWFESQCVNESRDWQSLLAVVIAHGLKAAKSKGLAA